MSKNHYLKLEKDDLVFVNGKKKGTRLFVFDGEGFSEMNRVKITNDDIEITAPEIKIGDSITDALSRNVKDISTKLSHRNRNLFT